MKSKSKLIFVGDDDHATDGAPRGYAYAPYDYYQCDDCDSTYVKDPIACDYCGSFEMKGMYHVI